VTGILDIASEGSANGDSVFYILDSDEEEIVIAGGWIRLENILITRGNVSASGKGGGIYVGCGAVLTAGAGARICGNRSQYGGGAYKRSGDFTATLGVLRGNSTEDLAEPRW
jgi:hypothetical protein